MSLDLYELDIDLPEVLQPRLYLQELESFFTLQFGGSCPCSVDIAATGVDSTHVRVEFDAAVLNNPAINCIDVWEIIEPSGVVEVLGVTPESDPVESILLTTTEHQSLPNYVVRLHFLETA